MTWSAKKSLLMVIGLLFSFNAASAAASAAAAAPATLGLYKSFESVSNLLETSIDKTKLPGFAEVSTGFEVSSIGTPRELSPEQAGKLINYLGHYFKACTGALEHLEANPTLIPTEIYPAVRVLMSEKKLTSVMIYFMACALFVFLWDAASVYSAHRAHESLAMVIACLFSQIDDVAYCMRPEVQAIMADLPYLASGELSYPRGITPLHAATTGYNANLVALMLARGMNPLLTDAAGKKALDYVAARYKAASAGLKPAILPIVRCLVQAEKEWKEKHAAATAAV